MLALVLTCGLTLLISGLIIIIHIISHREHIPSNLNNLSSFEQKWLRSYGKFDYSIVGL